MTGFSPTEAATEGLRLTRLRSRAVVIWGLAYFGFTILLGRLAELTLGPHSAELLAELQRVKSDSDAFWPLAGRMWPFFTVAVPVNMAFQAVLNCAIYRAVLEPRNTRHGYMHLGPDELRMVWLNLLVSLIWTAALFVVTLVALVISSTFGVIGSPTLALFGDAMTLGALALVIWILVRLSLAGAITFSERKVQVFKSWQLTQGRFWPLCWAYILAFLLWLALVVLLEITKNVIQFGVHLSGFSLAAYDPAWTGPVIFLIGLFSSAGAAVIWTCFNVILTAPSAEAYRELIEPS